MDQGMDKKETILMDVLPRAVLLALTPEAREAVPSAQRVGDAVVILAFPFRVGRESRIRRIDGRIERIERAKGKQGPPNNDLYLVDGGQLLNISREHFQIEKAADGYVLVDRGSACGTRVNDELVGSGDTGGRCILRDGDVIAAGTKGTPYQFRFYSFEEYELSRRG
jgi:pSer/pThr/pTyr-binding forkhead associated (FHA) protein